MKRELSLYKHACKQVLAYAEAKDYEGYGKFDALNSPLLKQLTLGNKWLRLIASQVIKLSPINIRPLLGVQSYKNPKGMGLLARAYFNRYKIWQNAHDLKQAEYCLNWLLDNRSPGYSGDCWGYNWDWQDLGFFAPFGSPNCVVTAFVCQAMLDGYEVTGNHAYLETVISALDFIEQDLKVLYEDDQMKCVSYVPDEHITMVVMDVSALAGAVMARVYQHTHNATLAHTARKLLTYVVDKQTSYGAWFYTHPPGDSPVKHDNYHTGFILDAILDYELATGDTHFRPAYKHGLDFYQRNLFLDNGAPRWMSHRDYPFDIHGAATGIGTFARAALAEDSCYLAQAKKIAFWTINNMQAPEGYFYYQQGRRWTKKFTLMRWCNAWMAHGLSYYLLAEQSLSTALPEKDQG